MNIGVFETTENTSKGVRVGKVAGRRELEEPRSRGWQVVGP